MDYMRRLGYEYTAMEEQGVIMPVTNVSVRYLEPLRFDDTIRVRTRLTSFNGVRVAFSYEMFREGNQFYGGDGIVTKGVENTIRNIGRLAHDGMAQTDKEIIDIMLHTRDN